jgi:hypothetical protein
VLTVLFLAGVPPLLVQMQQHTTAKHVDLKP